MHFPKISLLGVSISVTPRLELLLSVSNYLSTNNQKAFTIFTPNPEQVVDAQNDETFREILNSADIALPDGEGIVWAHKRSTLRLRSGNNFQKIPGVDFMEELCEMASGGKYPVALIGGRYGVAQKALTELQRKYPGLNGWAEETEEFQIKNQNIANSSLRARNGRGNLVSEKIASPLRGLAMTNENYFLQLADKLKKTNIKLVFVGLGAPKQEYFIENIKYQISNIKFPILFMSVGGAFDILSGRIKRAPIIIQLMKLEWLWRLMLEPWRIKRQMKLIKFVYLVITHKK